MSSSQDEQVTAGYPQPPWPPPYAGPPKKKHRLRKAILLCLAGVAGSIVLISVVASLAGTPHKAASPVARSSPSFSPFSQSYSPVPASSAPAAAPASPGGTVSQQQALQSAQSYLSDGQGFSRKGLIDQLSSSSGEGFSHADAVWAVDHSGADWNAQAVDAAKGYMASGQGFSRQGLIDQLSSAYGDQFTYAQAVYAVNQVGL